MFPTTKSTFSILFLTNFKFCNHFISFYFGFGFFWFVGIDFFFSVCVLIFYFKASSDPGFYFVDCAFSVLVIGTLVLFVWRSMFALCDLLIYETDQSLSAWYSLVSYLMYIFIWIIYINISVFSMFCFECLFVLSFIQFS